MNRIGNMTANIWNLGQNTFIDLPVVNNLDLVRILDVSNNNLVSIDRELFENVTHAI